MEPLAASATFLSFETKVEMSVEMRALKAREDSAVSALPHGTTISEQSRVLYLSPYDRWERKLVRHLDRQPRSAVEYRNVIAHQGRAGLCHHNVQAYCRLNLRAKPAMGWLADGSGYVLHSVVELDGVLLEATPARLPIPFPFVRDGTLLIGWRVLDNGKTRAVITREGREMPVSLRTPKAARAFRQFIERGMAEVDRREHTDASRNALPTKASSSGNAEPKTRRIVQIIE